MLFKSLLGLAAAVASVAADLPEIEIVGNKFFYKSNGTQFLMKGIAYQQNPVNTTSSFVDPLADPAACKRDIPYMQAVNTNVIRVYAVNTSLDHTDCMNMLTDAGIYVIADLSQPDESINRDDPEWNVELYTRYTNVVDSFQNYSNVLGFFAGNEVTNAVNNTDASAYVKAAVRDTKAYIKAQGYRQIPVGYSANDDTAIRVSLADYFACGSEDERADFFGINMYEWCGKSSYVTSGYQNITDSYKNLGIPAFFSEYGCNEVQPRLFQEVGTLYGPEMTGVWSGGIVYMYFEEANNYGLVTIDSSGDVSTLQDYQNYQSQIKSISPSLAIASAESASSVSNTACPTATNNWEASTNLPPTPDQDVCACASSGSQCVVSSSVSSDDYGDLIGTVCGLIDCSGISGNGTSGTYGAFSPCDAKDQLNFILNLYYVSNGENSQACDFSGSATTNSASSSGSCSAILKSAGVSGLGSLSITISSGTQKTASGASATGTAASGSKSSSKSSSSSTSSGSPKSSGSAKQFTIGSVAKAFLVGGGFAIGLMLTVL